MSQFQNVFVQIAKCIWPKAQRLYRFIMKAGAGRRTERLLASKLAAARLDWLVYTLDTGQLLKQFLQNCCLKTVFAKLVYLFLPFTIYTLLGCQNHIISQQELHHRQNLTRYHSVVLSLDNFYLQIPFYHRINYCHYCHFENKEDKSKTLKEKE